MSSGLEPLLTPTLYSELLGLSQLPCYQISNAEINTLFVRKDGQPLSPDAIRVLAESPNLLNNVLGYMKEPTKASLDMLRQALASSLGIRGNARSDYKIQDPAVGL